MKTRIALNGNDGNQRIGIGEKIRWESFTRFDWSDLDTFLDENAGATIFVSLSYELRKQLFPSGKTVEENFPLIAAWVPESVYLVKNDTLLFSEGSDNEENEKLAREYHAGPMEILPGKVEWKPRQSKADYLAQIRFLKDQIQLGNLYEVNYCQEFFAENVSFDSFQGVYQALNAVSKAPFSLLYESENWMIASASPERFLKKTGTKLISQPIKGTARRGKDEASDLRNKQTLTNSHKDKTENVMIVDLVRNDLSRIAAKGSVKVDELFGIHTFPTVHQMISTISCELKPEVRFSDILKATFPMGSMTGAPKVAAMDVSNSTERFKRGIYSGSIGYIDPNGDFDLNVMIRSFVHDRRSKTLSCGVGGAITIFSDPEGEYEECRTKVGRILETIGTCQW